MIVAETIVAAIGLWGTVGALVALAFLTFGIDRIDEDAQGAYVFRILLIPGVLVIWPLVLWRWGVLEAGRDLWQRRYAPPHRAHLLVGVALPVLIVLLVVVGLSQRQTWPEDIAPEQLSSVEPTQ